MPHQCLGCNTVYPNTSNVIIKGCPNCGHKLFLYLKEMPKEGEEVELTTENKEILLKEVEDIVGDNQINELENVIVLKLENVRVLAPGKYEIDINQLLKKERPLIYKIQEGTYVIDLKYLS